MAQPAFRKAALAWHRPIRLTAAGVLILMVLSSIKQSSIGPGWGSLSYPASRKVLCARKLRSRSISMLRASAAGRPVAALIAAGVW